MHLKHNWSFLVLVVYTSLQVEGFQYPVASGDPCIIINLKSNITVKELKEGESKSDYDISNAEVSRGRCAGPKGTPHLDLKLDDDVKGTLSFTFSRTEDARVIMDLVFTFVPDRMFDNGDKDEAVIPDIASTTLSSDTASYTCQGVQDIEFEEEITEEHVYIFNMTIKDVQIQAFNIKNGKLSPAQDCTLPTTPKPGSPEENTYTVAYNNGSTCIMFVGGIQFIVPYTTRNNPKQTSTRIIGIPVFDDGTKYSGNCLAENNTQDLVINFYKGWKIRFVFSKSSNTDYFLSLLELTANLTSHLFPDILEPKIEVINQTFPNSTMSASSSGSFHCTDFSLTLPRGFVFETFNLQCAAFQANITEFSQNDVTDCLEKKKNSLHIFPIVAGAVIILIILIILIIYLRSCSYDPREFEYEKIK